MSTLTRRSFLGAIGLAAAGLALDPDRALWVPGQKRIFLPAQSPSLWSATELNAGDIFTIDGMFAVNPKTYCETGFQQTFIITANVHSGRIDPSMICPRLVFEGPYQSVSGVLTPNARIRPVMWGHA